MFDIIFLFIDKYFNLLCKFFFGIGYILRNLIYFVFIVDILYNGIFNKYINYGYI